MSADRNQLPDARVVAGMGILGSFGLGFLTFGLTAPVSVQSAEYSCVAAADCPTSVTTCLNVLGWQDVLGPLGCSPWAAVGAGMLVGLASRAIGRLRSRATRQASSRVPTGSCA